MEINELNIKNILAEVSNINKEELEILTVDSDLRNIGIDSLTSIELVVKLEEQFSISINDDDLSIDNVCSIKNIMELVKKYI
jgi:acyl carrier protein